MHRATMFLVVACSPSSDVCTECTHAGYGHVVAHHDGIWWPGTASGQQREVWLRVHLVSCKRENSLYYGYRAITGTNKPPSKVE